MKADETLARKLGRVLERVTRQSGRLPKKTPAYGSWLLGRRVETAGRRRVRIQVILTVFISVINVVGIAVAALLVLVAFPEPDIFEDAPLRYGVVIMPVYVISALAVGTWLLTDTTVNALRWATERRRPTVDDQRSTFMIPWRVAVVHIALWGGAAVLSTVLFGRVDAAFIPRFLGVLGIVGAMVATFSYLATEFTLRPIAAQAPRPALRPAGSHRASWGG